MGIFLSCLVIVALIVVSAFFSASETALTAASRVRMHAMAKEKNARAALVNKIKSKKERMIGALLLGNNLANIMASALATSVLISIFGEAGVIYATGIMTVLVLIFAEVLPKTYALHAADRAAMFVAPGVNVVTYLLAPLTGMVAWIVRKTLKLLGHDISVVNVGDHVELLRGVIDLHQGPEEETQHQRAMLRSILDLADVQVGDIMIHRRNLTMIDASMPVREIMDHVLESPFTRLPLWRDEQDNIIGVVHVKWLLREIQSCHGDFSKIDIQKVATEPWFIPDTTTLYDQLQAFRRRREHFAMVVDEYGTLMGVVTLEDILEEIVGDIDDEHDVTMPGVRRQSNGTYLVDGTVTIRELNREFDWSLRDENYSTIAGLVLYESKTIPDAGQSFSFQGFRFDVMRRHRNQLTLIRVTPPLKEEPEKEI